MRTTTLKAYTLQSLLLIILAIQTPSRAVDRALTARAYYHALLAQTGLHQELRADHTESVDLFTIFSHEPTAVRLRVVNAALGVLLSGVARKAGRLGYAVHTSEVFVGEFPLMRLNARTLRAPSDGILILVNRGLVIALYNWATIVANMYAHHYKASQLGTDASIATLRDELRTSVRRYREFAAIPHFPQYATDEQKRLMAAGLAISALDFVIAHEYAHAIRGETQATLEQGSTEVDEFMRESLSDLVAADILVRAASERNDLPAGLRLAGAFYCVAMYSLLETGSENWDGQFFARGTLLFQFANKLVAEGTLSGNDLRLTNELMPVLDDLLKAAAPKPEPADLDDETRRQREFWIAFKRNEQRTMDRLVSLRPSWLATWANDMVSMAERIAEGPIESVSGGWTDGDFADAADLFLLSAMIDDANRRVTSKSVVGRLSERGKRIVASLRCKEQRLLESGLPAERSFATRVGVQARRVESYITGRKQ